MNTPEALAGIEPELAARAAKFAYTLPRPFPIRFCIDRSRPVLDETYDAADDKLERLAMAMEHLEKVAVTTDPVDLRANWCISIVLFQSAVAGMKVPWEKDVWQAVRHHIAHTLGLKEVTDPDFAEVAARAAQAYGSSWLPDSDDVFMVPKTDQGAIPILDYRKVPSEFAVSELGWDIREARCVVALSTLGRSESLFVAWENAMTEVTARIWCDWKREDIERFFNVPLGDWMGATDYRAPNPVPVPRNYREVWTGFFELLSGQEKAIREWMLDEWLVWHNAQVTCANNRSRRHRRPWSPVCERHGKRRNWTRAVPMCEALGLDDGECDEYVKSGNRPSPTLKRYLQPFLPKNTPYL